MQRYLIVHRCLSLRSIAALVLCCLTLDVTTAMAEQQGRNPLEDTSWKLVEFQSMDDAIGVSRPNDPSLYTMQLGSDGKVSMQLNCNRANGSWSAEAASDGSSGSMAFGSLDSTKMLCPPLSMDQDFLKQAGCINTKGNITSPTRPETPITCVMQQEIIRMALLPMEEEF